MNVEEAIKALPKVELHIHTLGSIQPSTLLTVIREDGLDTPYRTVEDIVRRFQYTDFVHFIEVYMEIVGYISDEKHFEHITFDMLKKCSECNTRYVEASFSPRDHLQHNLDFSKMVDAINRGIDRARELFSIETNIRIDLVRSSTQNEAMEVLDHIERTPHNIVSIDIGGNETRFPPKPFAEVYERAREMGLHLVAHAGEAAGPQSIWDAIEILKVERIGHGVSAREDLRLMELLKERQIGIEMNPISNIRTGVVKSIKEHPIREFFDNGLLVTVSSDDPSLFHTDLNNEYIQIHKHLGFTLTELFQLSLNGIETAFVDEAKKTALRDSFSTEYSQIMSQVES
jgi:adenosine deaminase